MMTAARRARELLLHPALPSVLTDALMLAYCAFTLVSQLTAMVDGTPGVLVPSVCVIAGAGVLLCIAFAVRPPAWFARYIEDEARPSGRDEWLEPTRAWLPIAAGLPLACAVLFVLTGSGWIAWGASLVLSLAALVYVLLARSKWLDADAPSTTSMVWVHACALWGWMLALLVVRARSDDAFYLAMARSVVAAADAPLLSENMIHGPPGALLGPQPMFAPYRVHSFEVMTGSLSDLLHVDVTVLSHLWIGPALAWLAPFAIARALRLLTPAWPVALLAVVAFYSIEGTASVGYANHAFIRMFHGKSVLLTIGVPLLIVHGLRFGRQPSVWRLGMLAAAQIVAVGASSTGIWLAPMIAMIAVLAGTPGRARLLRHGALSTLSSLYVLGLGLWVMAQMHAASAAQAKADAAQSSAAEVVSATAPGIFDALREATDTALGTERTAVGLALVLAFALVLSRSVPAVRLLSGLALSAALLATPFATAIVSKYVTGVSTFHRLYWLVPIPLAFGVLVASVFSRASARGPSVRAAMIAFAVAALTLVAVTERTVLSADNHARFVFPPALKIGSRALSAAQAACQRTKPGEYILAPASVSEQIALRPTCGYPILVAERWLNAPQEELQTRVELVRYVSTDQDVPLERAEWFLAALRKYRFKVVITLDMTMRSRRLKSLLRWAGYEKLPAVEGNYIWVPTSSKQHSVRKRAADAICSAVGAKTLVYAPFGVSRAIATSRCARVRLNEGSRKYGPTDDQAAQLERMLTSSADRSDEDVQGLNALLADPELGAVVISSGGKKSDDLLQLLEAAHFVDAGPAMTYRVFVRKRVTAVP